MATINDASALFKRVFGDGTIKAVPDFAKLQKEVPFSKKEKLGDMYVVPVLLAHEQGFSYGAHGDGAFSLNAAVAGAVKQAQVRGSMIVLRSQLSYEDVYKAVDSGPAAFESSVGLVVDNMQNSFAKRQELMFLYGQNGLGIVDSNTAVSPATSPATVTLVLTAASWAPGIWSGMKDAILEAFTGITATEAQHNANLVVSSVDYIAKSVIVSGTADAVVAGDVLYFLGARTTTAHKEAVGLDKIISTTSGTIFNINASSYELWRGQSYAISGAISMLGVLNAAAQASNLGLMEKAKLYLPTSRWTKLNSDQAALRRYGAQTSKAESGFQAISYYSTNGEISVEAHPFIKEGEGFLLANPAKRVTRVGASDISFRRSGMLEGEVFRELNDNAGLELRAFSDMGILLQTPAQNVKLTGIEA